MAQNRKAILSKLPPGTSRIQITTSDGETKWRELSQLEDTDEIVFQNGSPICMKGNPGRKRKAPQLLDPKIQALLKRKKDALDKDQILQSSQKDLEGYDVIDQVIGALGEETATLKFLRSELEREGQLKDIPSLSLKRIQGLSKLADTLFKKMDSQMSKTLDIESPSFLAAYRFVLETMKEAMGMEQCRPEQIEAVFSRFGAMSAETSWRAEMQSRIKMAQ